MDKKVFAVTNIKISSDKSYEAGQELNLKELREILTLDQIKELYDAGAIQVREIKDEEVLSEQEDTKLATPIDEMPPEKIVDDPPVDSPVDSSE